jgi:hypothetical protein
MVSWLRRFGEGLCAMRMRLDPAHAAESLKKLADVNPR